MKLELILLCKQDMNQNLMKLITKHKFNPIWLYKCENLFPREEQELNK